MKLVRTAMISLCALAALPAAAQECIIGEVKLFAGNFAPQYYAFADGQILPIAQYQTLFAVLGATYGGNGQTNFALPDLRGRSPVHPGQGQGTLDAQLGEPVGSSSTTLTQQQMPAHTHPAATATTLHAVSAGGDRGAPAGAAPAEAGAALVYSGAAPDAPMSGGVATSVTTVEAAGGSQPVNTQSPALGLNYIVCLQGIYPSRP